MLAPDQSVDATTTAELPGLVQATGAQRGGKIWAGCELFGTVGTPAHFKPGSGPFDELYNVAPAGASFRAFPLPPARQHKCDTRQVEPGLNT